jgi:anthranilate phosphoribosyltransferase
MTASALARLLDPRPLSEPEAKAVFARLLAPSATEAERAGLLVAIAARPLAVDELASFAREMRARAVRFPVPAKDRPIDLCGSGGARTPSFNVSTIGALVVAASGAAVVKHGNRSATGICGSSDLLEALGLPVTTSLAYARETYRSRKIAFLHAPLYHPAARAVAATRRALGVPTVFNRLGPLCNPAAVPYQLAGAPDPAHARTCAAVLQRLGVARGLSMASRDGCDEFSPHAETVAFGWSGRRLVRRVFRPQAFLAPSERRGGWTALSPPRAAAEAERILAGGSGARRGAVLLTSGAALSLIGDAPTVEEGVRLARETLDSGSAAELLAELRSLAEPFQDGRP